MKSVFGDISNLRTGVRQSLSRLSERRGNPREFVQANLLKQAANIVGHLGVFLALLIDREGKVTHVVLGTKDRVYLPDLGRFRLDKARLRRLRLIVFTPLSEQKLKDAPRESVQHSAEKGKVHEVVVDASSVRSPVVQGDLITDLVRLRLDALLVVAVTQAGIAGPVTCVHLEPAQQRLEPSLNLQLPYRGLRFMRARSVVELGIIFSEFIEGLETAFRSTQTRTFDASLEQAVLVGAYTKSAKDAQSSMDELYELASTAGIQVLDCVIQRRSKLDPKTLIGKGKVEELVLHCLDLGADLLVFDGELTPGQLRSITNLTELRVIDRSMLILDIFAQRAKSSEGRLQVELAQLKYSLPRLTETDTGLSRLTGGIGGRGPGETKLEIGRRRARDRIAGLEKEINRLARQRGLRRQRRQDRGVPVISIVGYTNAGKSTLINALTKGDVFVEDKLFATLDPSSRRMRFPNEKEVIFVDTVGFIRELPKELVAAFRATLEEIGEADLLLHVVDASDAAMREHFEVVTTTLEDLGFAQTPRLVVLNKIDRLSSVEVRSLLSSLGGIPVSALKRTGFEPLVQEIQDMLHRFFEGQDPGRFLEITQSADQQ